MSVAVSATQLRLLADRIEELEGFVTNAQIVVPEDTDERTAIASVGEAGWLSVFLAESEDEL